MPSKKEKGIDSLQLQMCIRDSGKVKFACVDGPEFDGHEVNFDEAMRRQQIYKTAEGRAMRALEEGETHHGGCGNCQ